MNFFQKLLPLEHGWLSIWLNKEAKNSFQITKSVITHHNDDAAALTIVIVTITSSLRLNLDPFSCLFFCISIFLFLSYALSSSSSSHLFQDPFLPTSISVLSLSLIFLSVSLAPSLPPPLSIQLWVDNGLYGWLSDSLSHSHYTLMKKNNNIWDHSVCICVRVCICGHTDLIQGHVLSDHMMITGESRYQIKL